MKVVKSLLLGTAAGLIAVGGAQAADLPVKAKAVEYVKVCSLYGAGFYYIPGSDTCIKLGGYLRAEVALNAGGNYSAQYNNVFAANNRLTNYYSMRAREDLNIDTRTATEYGVVRTYFDAVFTWTTGNYVGAGSGTGATQYSGTLGLNAAGTGLIGSSGGAVNGTDGTTSGGSLGVYYAFIQFAGFTMGKAVSQFDAPFSNYPGNNFDGLVGGSGTITGAVTGTDGLPLGGVEVTVSSGDFSATTSTLTTGTPGAYTVSDIPTPGNFTVTFALEGYVSETRMVGFLEPSTVPGVSVTMHRADASISGTVTGGGAPIAGAAVELSDGITSRTTATASVPNGGYVFTGVAPGSYTLTVTAANFRRTIVLVTVVAGEALTRDVPLVAGP